MTTNAMRARPKSTRAATRPRRKARDGLTTGPSAASGPEEIR
ncbi:MAG: hypothetical protein QOG01_2400 [Pseudonocardiales bacterium]|jgi:hypothetical protein|nr:hypothetical protein [Pseudonocardiales bacterium]